MPTKYICVECLAKGKELQFHSTICTKCKCCICIKCWKSFLMGIKGKIVEMRKKEHVIKEHESPIDLY